MSVCVCALVRVYLLTLGACARGLQYLLCVCVCPAFAGAIKQLYSMVNTKISFLLSILHFQLMDFSKSTSFTNYGSFLSFLRHCGHF